MSNKPKEISTLIKAGAKVVQIVSYERQRVHSIINEISIDLDLSWFRWSFVSGLDEYDKDDNEFKSLDTSLTDPVKVIKSFREEGFKGILILEDYHHFLENPQSEERTREIIRHLREIADIPKNVPKNLILSQPIKMIPIELMKEMAVVEIELPKIDILEVIFYDVIKQFQLTSDKYSISTALIDAALGLTVMEARLAFAKAIVEQGKIDQDSIELIIKEKEAIIKKRGLLEYYHPEGGLDSVGGLDKLKEWLLKRGKAFEEGAEEYGLDKPRGVLLLGIPGCGKSLSAKAIAKVWHFPLLRFDLGKVYAGIVGQSEQNIRNALDIAQALAPCVLWIDEIEKGLSGVSSSDQTD